jgi:CDP-glycerol glycerophosphotransferase
VICVDDASVDGSVDIAADHARGDDRFVVVRHETNLGAGAARNSGLDRAGAPFV